MSVSDGWCFLMEEKGFLSSLISKKYGETKMEHKNRYSIYKGEYKLNSEGNKKITTPRHLERFFKSNDLEPIGWEFEYDEEYGVDFIDLSDGLEDSNKE